MKIAIRAKRLYKRFDSVAGVIYTAFCKVQSTFWKMAKVPEAVLIRLRDQRIKARVRKDRVRKAIAGTEKLKTIGK